MGTVVGGYPSDNDEETEQKETEDEGKEKNDEMFKKKRAWNAFDFELPWEQVQSNHTLTGPLIIV